MKTFLNTFLAFAFAVLALVAGTASAQTDFNPLVGVQSNDARKIAYLSVPNVQNVPLTGVGGSSDVLTSTTLSNGTWDLTVAAADSPDSLRELVIFQNENTGTDLSIEYVITFTTWDGTESTVTVTIDSDGSFFLPYPVATLEAVEVTISGSAASDSFEIGYRGFYVPGAFLDSSSVIVKEAVAGLQPSTGGTIVGGSGNYTGAFYLPNSISAGNSLYASFRTKATSGPPRLIGITPSAQTLSEE